MKWQTCNTVCLGSVTADKMTLHKQRHTTWAWHTIGCRTWELDLLPGWCQAGAATWQQRSRGAPPCRPTPTA